MPNLENESLPATTTASELSGAELTIPDGDQLPDKDLLVFDGQCGFCRAQVGRLKWFSQGRMAFVSLHDPRVAEWFPDISREQLMQQMYVVTTDGNRFAGAAALRYLSRRLPRLWFAAPFLHIPFTLPLWQSLYMWIARNRYRITGHSDTCENDACRIHTD